MPDMGIRDYLKDPKGRSSINRAIRSAFERRRGGVEGAQRLLVVGDDPLTRETLVRALQRARYDVVGAKDRNQALDLFDERPFDLVITEFLKPERKGLETVAALRGRSPELKIVAVSEHDPREGSAPSSGARGASHTLVKPFDTQQLLQAVKNLLEDD